MKKLLILFLLLTCSLSFGVSAYAEGYGLSPAIDVLKNSVVMQKSGIIGTSVNFSRTDFEKTAGTDISYIVISSLPPRAAGVLTLYGEEVVEGQTIPASAISYLTFTPLMEGLASTSFLFRAGAEEWSESDIPCIISMKSGVNVAPIVSSERIETVENIPIIHTLAVADPNGDEVTVCVKNYPQNGTLTINSNGTVKYTPSTDFQGKDTFSYTATDSFGLSSEVATVTVNVTENQKNITFADMEDNDAYSCAVMMSQNDVMTYALRGGEYYFSPTEKVTRIDYLVMLISALGLDKEAVPCEDTLFDDDVILTNAAKGYLALALKEDIVSLGDGKFSPTDNITRSEAEQMAISGLNAVGYAAVLSTGENPNDQLTKADVAKLLAKAMGTK